jgi:uncharacterized LabA/DUF88 family protein
MAQSPEVDKLASDPTARVIVFIDGQNLYKTCQELFGHPLCHPHLLAEALAGPRTSNRVGARYYTGRPDPNRPAERFKARNLDRRLDLISRYGATVCRRPLRYHWDWGHKQNLPAPGPEAAPQTVTMHPWERPQEKGIDVLIALDVIEFILTNLCDVAIVVSLDRDLREIPEALRNLKGLIERPYRLEAAVPVDSDHGVPKQLSGFNHTHQITPSLFDLIRDDTPYNARDAKWTVPTFPRTIAEARAAKGVVI